MGDMVLFDKTTTIAWLPNAIAMEALRPRVDTLLFVWCLSGQGSIGGVSLESCDYCMLKQPIASVAGDCSLLCHFADVAACRISDLRLNDPAWESFCETRKKVRRRGMHTGAAASAPGVSAVTALLAASASGAAQEAGQLAVSPTASKNSPDRFHDEGLLQATGQAGCSESAAAIADCFEDEYHEHPIPVSTVHHVMLDAEDEHLSDLALRCLRSWAYGHRQVVWHFFGESYETPAVSWCEWRAADAIASKDELVKAAKEGGLSGARLAFASRVLQSCGGAFSDLTVFWLGRRLPPASPHSLSLSVDHSGCGVPRVLFARSRSPSKGPSFAAKLAAAGDVAQLAKYVRGWGRWHLEKVVGCWMVVDTVEQCQLAEAALLSAVAEHPSRFLPGDAHAEARRRARSTVGVIAPLLRAMIGDSIALRVQADVLDALYLRGRWDVVPLGMPAAIAVALVAVMMFKYCTRPEDCVQAFFGKLCDVVVSQCGSQALQLVGSTPLLLQVRTVLPKARAFVLNHFNVIPAARGVDYGVPL